MSALNIDWTACEGRGLCVDLLPELLESDPWGYPKTRTETAPISSKAPISPKAPAGSLVAVPDRLERPARRAVHLCPRLALRLSP
jgi:ferredoxin